MLTLTTRIATSTTAADRDAAFLAGYDDGRNGRRDMRTADIIAAVRHTNGFVAVPADMLTPPDANVKLDKTVAYGLTLAHGDMSGYQACPWIGHCGDVCVLNNGNGRYNSVQRAWLWRTAFLADHPVDACYRIGWELGRAVRKNGAILFRPNVNSDVLWHRVIPAMGTLPEVKCYGYSKNPAVLRTDGWQGGIRVCYSRNENSDDAAIGRFLSQGGSVAAVTNRRPGTPVDPDAVRAAMHLPGDVDVVDADVTDAWMFAANTVGDLSAKGKARELIAVSPFVLMAY